MEKKINKKKLIEYLETEKAIAVTFLKEECRTTIKFVEFVIKEVESGRFDNDNTEIPLETFIYALKSMGYEIVVDNNEEYRGNEYYKRTEEFIKGYKQAWKDLLKILMSEEIQKTWKEKQGDKHNGRKII